MALTPAQAAWLLRICAQGVMTARAPQDALSRHGRWLAHKGLVHHEVVRSAEGRAEVFTPTIEGRRLAEILTDEHGSIEDVAAKDGDNGPR